MNKVLKTIEVMLQERNREKISDVQFVEEDDYYFKYKGHLLGLYKFTERDLDGNTNIEYGINFNVNPFERSSGIFYRTNQRDYWSSESRTLFETLFNVIVEKYYGLDNIFNDILADDNTPIFEDEITF